MSLKTRTLLRGSQCVEGEHPELRATLGELLRKLRRSGDVVFTYSEDEEVFLLFDRTTKQIVVLAVD